MISIIIPTYNRHTVLQRCIESIISQHYQGIEIIIVDDCSTDATPQYLKQVTSAYSYIKVIINKENRGVNFSRNRGIEIVSNPYLMFIDSDDQLLPGSMSNILTTINNNAGTSHYLFLLSYRRHEFESWLKPKEVSYKDFMSGALSGDFTHVVLTEVFKKFMFFEQFRMFEQINWFRIYRATSPQLLVPIAVADIELGRTDSLSTNQKLKSILEVEAKFLSENFFYELFYNDLKKYNPSYLEIPLLKNILGGIACNRKKEAKFLIRYADKFYVRLIAYLLLVVPSKLALTLITGVSNLKNRPAKKDSL